MNALERTISYHERTKHHFDRSAAALGYLDWATQPDPFRRYLGAPLIPLALVPQTAQPTWDALFRPRAIAPLPFDRALVERVLFDSLALSAWKEHQGNRWALRVNPSSGNLHPTEGYVLIPEVRGLCSGPRIAHYAPKEHGLEIRCEVSTAIWDQAFGALPQPSFLIGLTSILWREAWKYGERSFRYCQHDTGHAIAAVAIAAGLCGWSARIVSGLSDGDLACLFGVATQRGAEREHPECLLVLTPKELPPNAAVELRMAREVGDRIAALAWVGEPNTLSREHHEWPILADVAEATSTVSESEESTARPTPLPTTDSTPDSVVRELERDRSARMLVHQRRSAVAMDGETGITEATFCTMLARVGDLTMPPRATLPWSPAIDLLFFVHRVQDVLPGLYLLVGDPRRREVWRRTLRSELALEPVDGLLAHLCVSRLRAVDVRREAALVSCHQDIASDGAFAVAMVAEFEPALRERGAAFYRRLHWEAGVIGQTLYLEAEAAGVRATGIGCFFDDAVHGLLGLRDRTFQTIYHFTVGSAVDDPRLRTLEPYAHRVS